MKFARWVFNIASVYGVISVAPLYFMERTINQQNPPSITHPMFFYGFTGVTLAWQLLFAIARQPMRLRPVIPFAVLEKLSFGLAAMVLYRQARLDHNDLWFASSTRPTPQHLRVPSLALFASAVSFYPIRQFSLALPLATGSTAIALPSLLALCLRVTVLGKLGLSRSSQL